MYPLLVIEPMRYSALLRTPWISRLTPKTLSSSFFSSSSSSSSYSSSYSRAIVSDGVTFLVAHFIEIIIMLHQLKSQMHQSPTLRPKQFVIKTVSTPRKPNPNPGHFRQFDWRPLPISTSYKSNFHRTPLPYIPIAFAANQPANTAQVEPEGVAQAQEAQGEVPQHGRQQSGRELPGASPPPKCPEGGRPDAPRPDLPGEGHREVPRSEGLLINILFIMLKTQADIRLMGFVPALVVNYFIENKNLKFQLPSKYTFESIVMFADVSGFTALTEKLSQVGGEGSELIAFAINRYMELLISSISRSGGDIFKFAGDAIIVVWPPSNSLKLSQQLEDMIFTTRQAIQSALDIQQKLNDTQILENVRLSVKIGFGFGEVSLLYVGGVFGRCEYLATGEPLTQAFESEGHASGGGQIVVSPEVHRLVSGHFVFEEVAAGYMRVVELVENQKVKMKAEALLMSAKVRLGDFEEIKERLMMFIPAAVSPFIEIDAEAWSNELRRLTVVFLNLAIDLSDDLPRIQAVIQTVQKCVYLNEGSLNKLLMDDKGTTLILCFGLPPLIHQDDATRAIVAAFLLHNQLANLACQSHIGIATGSVFAGVVGSSGARREYSVLGDAVNLAARLMQKAKQAGKPLLCCQQPCGSFIISHKGKPHRTASTRSSASTGRTCSSRASSTPPPSGSRKTSPQGNSPSSTPSTASSTSSGRTSTRCPSTSPPGGPSPTSTSSSSAEQNSSSPSAPSSTHSFTPRSKARRTSSSSKAPSASARPTQSRTSSPRSNTYLYIPILIPSQEFKDHRYKFEEGVHFLVSSLNHYTKMQKMNAIKQILKQMIEIYEKRPGAQQPVGLEELVAEENVFERFPKEEQEMQKEERKEIRRRVKGFCDKFFEEEGCAPVILVLDDVQYYDEVSFDVVRMMVKRYWKVSCIGLVRDSFQDYRFTRRDQKRPNEEQAAVVERGLGRLGGVEGMRVVEMSVGGLAMVKMEELIRTHVGIRRFVYDREDEELAVFVRRQRTLAQEWQTHIEDDRLVVRGLYDNLLFFESKGLLKTYDFSQFVLSFLYLKSNGNPSLLLDLMHVLLSNHYILVRGADGVVQSNFASVLQHEEWLPLDAPRTALQLNGPLADRLSCLEALLLKVASVIGDTFDVQTLYKVFPLKDQITPHKLIAILADLTHRHFIELMHQDDTNIYYRFVNVFMREVLYQRLIYAQRRHLHKLFAEVLPFTTIHQVLQVMPQVFEYDDKKEYRKLEYHWYQCEQSVQVEGDKFIKKKNIYIQGYSEKAKRSVIVKKVSELHNLNKQSLLKTGLLMQKINSRWHTKYCSISNEYMMIYETVRHFQRKEAGTQIPLKDVGFVLQLQNRRSKFAVEYCTEFLLQSNVVIVNGVVAQDNGLFHFASESDDDLEEWVIYLEFTKAKAVYEQFVDKFGKISFPINLHAYDQTLLYEIRKQGKVNLRAQQKQQLSHAQRKRTLRLSLDSSQLLQRGNHNEMLLQQRVKEQVDEFIKKSLLVLWSHLFSQDYMDDLKLGQANSFMKRHAKFLQCKKYQLKQ